MIMNQQSMKTLYSIFNIIFIILLPLTVFHQYSGDKFTDEPIVAIYNGNGSWIISVIAFERFLDWKNISWVEITEDEINHGDLTKYKVVYFPGGWAGEYIETISNDGFENLRRGVFNGLGYIGICAGAYLAADKVVFEGVTYDYPLKIFRGIASGSIHSIAPWSNYTMTPLDINESHPINKFEPPIEYMLYYGGPYFQPYGNQNIDVIATWREYDDKPAIISFRYGKGRVVLIGAHPEIEEDSLRDNSCFADEFDDNGSDWYLLWTLLDWVISGEVTEPPKLRAFITKPQPGYLYFLDNQLLYVGKTIIVGGVTIEAKTENNSYYEIKNVTFYIDDEIRYIDEISPYTWFYDEQGFNKHRIGIVTYSVDGKTINDEKWIWMMNLG